VEDGEDCDCGGEQSCGTDACCDAKTCKFKGNAVCDDANEDCCRNCQYASADTVCRSSTGVCDPEEKCTGTTATCPADKTAPDGQSCGNGTSSLHCASGQCTSRDQQCKTLMGSYTQGNDTYACNSVDCTISCASPEFGSGVCYGLQQNFLDGTTCGGGGKCQNGQCKGSSTGKEIRSWISTHKPLVIGIASALGVVVLFMLLGCIFRCCRRSRRRQKGPPPPPHGWNQPPMRPSPPQPGWNQPPMGPSPGQGGGQYWQPPPPPYPQPMPSVRYA